MVVYVGFVIGFLNTYLFTREGSGFTKTDYGLISIFIAIALAIYSFSNFGMPAYIYKFYPYYNDNLPRKKNDQLTWALLFSTIGFVLVMIAGVVFKDFVIRKFGGNSPLLIKYYYWVFPFGFGLTIFSILEAYAWQLKKSVFTNFLKEMLFRLFATLLIILSAVGLISNFDLFIKLYSLTYIGIAAVLLIYLLYKKNFSFNFSVSIVTKKFFKKILVLISFIYSGSLLSALSTIVDSIIIAAVLPEGLAQLGVYTLAQNISSLIQAPQRGIISSSIAPLSQAWKDKDMKKIDRIYHSSSINQLIFSVGMFALIWLNFTDGVFTFHLQSGYLDAKWIFFYLGLMRIVDMGTGLNSQIIGTSTRWRFDFFTGIILLALTWPITYVLTKYYFGVAGPAVANLITFTIYNAIRYWFLLKKFKMQPFTIKTLYTVLLGGACYYICHLLFSNSQGFVPIVLRSTSFVLLFATGVLALKLSPDVIPVWRSALERIGIKKGDQ